MSHIRKASIIITNYNYGRFLKEAIDSALNQTYPSVEVIVVDDGSADNSERLMKDYGDKIVPIYKENGGQSSAFNAGFYTSKGDVIFFLDADDIYVPTVVENTMSLFLDQQVVKAHWPLQVVDNNGRKKNAYKPPHTIPEGDLRHIIERDGPESPVWPPTSGNAWSRRFLDNVFPLPEPEKSLGIGSASADAYLSMLAPLFGRVRKLDKPQGYYRFHGQNDHSAMSFDKKLTRDLMLFDFRSSILIEYCKEKGVEANPNLWRQNSWFHKLLSATQEIKSLIPAGARFILVDDGAWNMEINENYHPIPFLECEGQYWGPPPEDATAIKELERLRAIGVHYFVFAWPAFWWLDYYSELAGYLRSNFYCILENERLVIFLISRYRRGSQSGT